MGIENVIEECGGFGKYQMLLIFGICIHRIPAGWSMLQMSYAGFIPDWYCVLGHEIDNSSLFTNETLKKCSINNSYTGYQENSCYSHHFGGPAKTVITEWDLVCDLKWVKATLTSIQMAGVLVGAASAGQLSETFGRRKTIFGVSFCHCLLNFGAAFSMSWEMFAVFRFFLGMCIGGVLVVTYVYPMEFLPIKWRPILGSLPEWAIGVCLFAVSALILDDWASLHLACGVVGLPALIGYFYVPESPRWQTLNGYYKEAEKTFEKMAIVNGNTPPKQIRSVLEKIYQEEQSSRSKARKYTYRDLFKGKNQILPTFIFGFTWFTLSAVYYGISFGVSALSGNLYFNIFLLTIVDLPAKFATFYFSNRFGRKRTSIALLLIASITACGCLVVYNMVSSESRGQWITGLCMTAKMGVGAAWCVEKTWVSESYPTVVRSLGFGMMNTVARVGGIVAPFVMDLDNAPSTTYAIITCLLMVASIMSLFVSDTKGIVLLDSLAKAPKALDDKITKTVDINLAVIGDAGAKQEAGESLRDQNGRLEDKNATTVTQLECVSQQNLNKMIVERF